MVGLTAATAEHRIGDAVLHQATYIDPSVSLLEPISDLLNLRSPHGVFEISEGPKPKFGFNGRNDTKIHLRPC